MASNESRLSEWDERVSQRIADKSANHLTIASFFALSGNSQPWFILSAIFFIFDLFMDRSVNLLQLMVIGVSGLTTSIIKFTIKRQRPSQQALKKYIAKGDHYSFPSGHASRMACTAVIMICFFPTIGWLFAIWAIGVDIARIALQLHYVLDILGGTIIGGVIGGIFYIFRQPFLDFFNPISEWFPHVFK